MWHKIAILSAAGVLLAAWSGCGDAGPEKVRIEGTVRLEAAPVEQVQVSFHPQQGYSRVLSQVTGPDGRYEVDLPAGKYSVAIVYQIDEPMPMGATAQWVQSRSPIPLQYGDPTQSGLAVDVQSDAFTTFDFNLQE